MAFTGMWRNVLRPRLRTLKNRVLSPSVVELEKTYTQEIAGVAQYVAAFQFEQEGYCSEIPDPSLASFTHRHSFPDRLIFKLRGVVFDSRDGQYFLKGHPVAECFSNRSSRPRFLFARLPFRQRFVRENLVAVGRNPWNYYHWLLEDLPVVLRAQRVLGSVNVVLGRQPPRYIGDSLDSLGIPYEIARGFAEFPEVFLPSRGNDAGWHHSEDIRAIRESFLKKTTMPPLNWRKIYVSRRYSTRAFSNEKSVEEFFRAREFDVVFPEKLTFREQVALFSEAGLVAGNHGAGLSNIVFSPKGANLLEITAANNLNQCFETLADSLGFGYQRVVAQSERTLDSARVEESQFLSIERYLEEL